MRRSILYGIGILFGLLYYVDPCNAAQKIQTSLPQTGAADAEDFAVGPNWSDMFDWKLLKAFKSQKNRNVIVSPISLKIVLALLYGGSASVTKDQLQRVLNFHENVNVTNMQYEAIVKSLQQRHPNFTMNLGTGIFMKMKPEQKFQSAAKAFYDAEVVELDFDNTETASKSINKWAEQITQGHIRGLVQPDDLHNLVMLVANAVFFKGTWLKQFPRSLTHHGQFYISSNNTIDVQYMSISDYFYYADSKELQARIVRVPYQGDHYVMYFMLPIYKMGLPTLLDKLNPDILRKCLNLADLAYVDMVIPKFKFDFQSKMDEILTDMGLDSLFSNAASLPGIVRGDTVKLVVSSIVQKAGIEVNEEGTTAFAATDVQVVNKFGDVQGVFNATHPFLFFIEDRVTGTIVFSGKVENPIQSDALPLPPSNEPGFSRPISGGEQITNPLNVPSSSNNFGQNSVPLSVQSNGEYHIPNRPTSPSNVPSYNDHQLPQDPQFNSFDTEILTKLDRNNQNIFLSPASIKATMAMILEGAGGDSAKQIEDKLRVHNVAEARQLIRDFFNGLKDSGRTTLEAGHGIFVSNKFQTDRAFDVYRNTIVQNYKALVDSVDFSNSYQATQIINAWISQITNGLITDVLTPDNFSQRAGLVLASALYFKGDWKYEFNPTLTQERCFHSRSRGCINVNMMQITETFNYYFNATMDANIVELPYNDNTYSMLLIVPRTKQNNNIASYISQTNLKQTLAEMEPTEVILNLPKFEIDYGTDLKDALSSLGIRDIFTRKANLSGIVSSQHMSIDTLVHRARIEVGEKGTIAASVTVASVVPLISSSSPMVAADHPFAFLIYNKVKQLVIFEGVLNQPTEVFGNQHSNIGSSSTALHQNKQPEGQITQLNHQLNNYSPVKGSGKTNPVLPVPGIQQHDQQNFAQTSNPIHGQHQNIRYDSNNF